MSETIDVPVRDAATVLLLRERAGALEVLMLERHLDSDFVGGAFVFPGGKVDEADSRLRPELWSGIDPEVEAERMQCSPDLALGLYVAAVRETFEEAGVLLATRAGQPLTEGDLASLDLEGVRGRLSDRTDSWAWTSWLESERLVLDLGSLAWWSWWVTPRGVHRRFDTRFFTAALPAGQVAEHDRVETTHSVWCTPDEVLAAAAEGRVTVILPTRKNLEELGRFRSMAEVMLRRVVPPRIEPVVRVGDAGDAEIDHPTFTRPESF